MVIGMVRKTRMGFTMALTTPSRMATSMDEPKPETVTPGSILAVMNTATAVMRMLIII